MTYRKLVGSTRASKTRFQRRILGCLFAASAPLATRADDFYYRSNLYSNWDSTFDKQFAWLDYTAGVVRKVPGGGGGNRAFLLQSGTNGVANQMVVLNYAYSTPGLSGLFIDSGNTLQQNAATSVMSASYEEVGFDSGGTYNQSGGINITTAQLTVGYSSRANGTYNQSGGSLSSSSLVLGNIGTGTFNQSGNAVATVSDLKLGWDSLGNGTYSLGDNARLNVALSTYVGLSGLGTFNQSGGINTILQSLILGSAVGGSGTYNLTAGGVLSSGFEEIGSLGFGVFYQTGGNHAVSGRLTVSASPGTGSGSYLLQGGSLSADTVQLNGGGTFNQTGGTLSYTTFNMASGIVTGTLQNQGTFNYFNGTFAGRLLNQGVVNLGSSFTAGNGMENDSVVTISTNQTVILNGAGLDNEGTLTLAGGNLLLSNSAVNVNAGKFNLAPSVPFHLNASLQNTGTINLNGSVLDGVGSLTNSAGATIAGYGRLGANFAVNQGTLVPQGGQMIVTNSFTNAGIIQLTGGTTLKGAMINNTGAITGVGSVDSAVTNSGTLEPTGGTLIFNGPLTNATSGTINAAVGNKFLAAGPVTNAGTINLSGGVFDTDGQPVASTGMLIGYGTFRTGGFTNNGAVTFSGGNTTIAGPFTNSTNRLVSVRYNPALFTGPVVNNGTIKTTSTTVTFAGTYSGSGIYNSDPATNIFQSDINILPGGQVLGGVGDVFTVQGAYTNAGTYQNAGGTLNAQNVVNNGSLNQTAGQATMLALSGTGSLFVGGAGTASASADSLVQQDVTVSTGGVLNIGLATGLVSPVTISNALTITNNATVTFVPTATASTASGVKTNFVKTLNIGSNGLLDLQNHFVSVNNVATPFAKVHQYIDAAYHINAITGFGDYNGRGGVTSSVVKANADFMSVGYYDGALQDPANPDNVGQILGPNSNSGHGTGIPLSQILIRPTLTGDLNGDGVVNSYDVTIFNSFGLFGSNTNLGYQAGDLNGDGVVNAKDVTIFNSAGNFNSGSYLVAKAASTLTGRSASPATAELNPASGTLAFTYDPATGDVKVNYNGFTGFAGKQTFNTTNRALSLIDILSTGGPFALDSSKLTLAALNALSSPTFTGNTEINLTAVNGYLPDGTDLGRILAPGLDPQQLAGALTLSFNYTGSRQLSGGVAGLIVPEPATFSLIGFAALGLLARRRGRTAGH